MIITMMVITYLVPIAKTRIILNEEGRNMKALIAVSACIFALLYCLGTVYAQPPGTPLIENIKYGGGIDLSPDGQWIAYTDDLKIYLISVTGKGIPVNLTSTIEYGCDYPRFTPDSQRVMFNAFESPQRIESVDLKGDNFEVVIDEGSHGNWNRDGTLLAYYSSGSNIVMIYEPATGKHRVIYDRHMEHNSPPVFTVDGLSVVIPIMDNEGNHSIFRVPLDGSQHIEQLNSGYFESAHPRVSPDGRWILYYAKLVDERYPVRDLRALDLATGVDAPLYRSSYSIHMPVWSPDGSQIIYKVRQSLTQNYYDIHVDTFNGHANHGSITGTVIDANENTPNSDFTIVAHDGDKLVSSTKTDGQGKYRLMLLPGDYTVKAKSGQGVMPSDESVLTVSAGQETIADFTAIPIELPKILVRSMDRYKSLKGYRDTTSVEMHMVRPGMDNRRISPVLFAFERPNHFRNESTIDSQVGGMDLYCNGEKMVTYMGRWKQYTEEDVPEVLTSSNLQMVQSIIAQNIIMSDNPLEDLKKDIEEVKEIGSETLDGISTTIIELTQPVSSLLNGMASDMLVPVRMWIGSDDYLIWKVACELDMEQIAKSMPEEQRSGMEGFMINITEMHTEIESDPVFADDYFAFNPPEGAQLVDNFSPPGRSEPEEPKKIVGSPAPAFTLKDIDGIEVKLADFEGKVVLMDFWATWCGPCKKAMPHIQALSEIYQEEDVVVLGINSWEREKGKVEPFLEENKITYRILLDSDDEVAGKYGVQAIPTFCVVDKKGVIRYSYRGIPSDRQIIQQNVEELLAE